MPSTVLRSGRPGEAGALSELALRAKAHWGYDAAFLELCRGDLAVTVEEIAAGRVIVAAGDDDVALGFAIVDLALEPPELTALFVDPAAMRRGVGSRLLDAAATRAAAAGVESLLIESDPHAEAFYLARGARRVGERHSASTRRLLALLSLPTAADRRQRS